MKKTLLFTILVASTLCISCNKENAYSEYKGQWSGIFIGEDTGIWNVTINSDGAVNGTAVSDSFTTFPFSLHGNITENGYFDAEADLGVGVIDFEGQIQNSSVSGTWTSTIGNIQGTWSGKKD